MAKKLKVGGGEIIVDDDFPLSGTVIHICNGYAEIKRINLHVALMGPGTGRAVDHINGNKLDNRRCNLQRVPQWVNSLHKKARGRSGVLGVIERIRHKPFIAAAHIDGQRVTKSFETIDEAREWRRETIAKALDRLGVVVEGVNTEKASRVA